MSAFQTQPDMLRNESASMASVQKRMSSLHGQVTQALNSMPACLGDGNRLRGRMQVLSSDILNEAVKMESLAQALAFIGEAQKACENKITSTGATSGVSCLAIPLLILSPQILTGFKQFWHGILRFLGIEGDAPKKELTEDERLQKEVHALLDKEKYSKEAWGDADTEQRKQLLTEYYRDVAAVMGLDVGSKVNFFNQAPVNGAITKGYYDYKDSIAINEYVVKQSKTTSYGLYKTVIHELRHMYQYQAVKNPKKFIVPEETIEAWSQNFKKYITTSTGGYDAYRAQPIEADARWFAKQD